LGVVLAGGRSLRFGADKANASLCGKALLDRVCERAAPQVETLLVSRNDGGVYKPASLELLPDEFPGEGPLAGVLAGLARARAGGYAFMATFSCDTPFFPRETVALLHDRLATSGANICVAAHNGIEHRALAVWRTNCELALSSAFANGLRRLRGVGEILLKVTVEFPAVGEGPDGDAFFNINTGEDLARAERWMRSRPARSD